MTPEELAAADAAETKRLVNGDVLRERIKQALLANANYLTLASPSAAQNTAQVQRLTKECSALIKLVVGQLSDLDGTA